MSVEEKLGAARRRKELGNALFKAGKWRRALKKYKDAAQAVDYDVRSQNTSPCLSPPSPASLLHASR
jgi:hypothetical protein